MHERSRRSDAAQRLNRAVYSMPFSKRSKVYLNPGPVIAYGKPLYIQHQMMCPRTLQDLIDLFLPGLAVRAVLKSPESDQPARCDIERAFGPLADHFRALQELIDVRSDFNGRLRRLSIDPVDVAARPVDAQALFQRIYYTEGLFRSSEKRLFRKSPADYLPLARHGVVRVAQHPLCVGAHGDTELAETGAAAGSGISFTGRPAAQSIPRIVMV